MSWLYVPGTVASNSALISPDCDLERSVTWRGKHSRRRYWLTRWKKVSWLRLLSGLTLRPSTAGAGVGLWTSSLPDSRASLGHAPGSEKARTTTGGSGPTLPGSFGRWDRGSCSWKMFPALFEEALPSSSDLWPKWGSMRSGVVSRRERWVPRTGGSGCSSWASPSSHDGRRPGSDATSTQGMNLKRDAEKWLTPKACEGENPSAGNRKGNDLSRTARLFGRQAPRMMRDGGTSLTGGRILRQQWPTPSAQEASSAIGMRPSRKATNRKTEYLHRVVNTREKRLNPLFVEYLMGLPTGWTAFDSSATELSRSRRRWRSWSLRTVWDCFD